MFIDLLRKRRSVRFFNSRQIDPPTIDILKEALLRSPTSRGINPWNFILVTRRETLKKLATAKERGSAFLKDAALAVVITGNEMASDVWIEDCSIAAINLQLLATDLGLGSCWAQIRNRFHSSSCSSESFVQSLLGIPEHFRVGMIVGIGYPDQDLETTGTLDAGKVWMERFGKR